MAAARNRNGFAQVTTISQPVLFAGLHGFVRAVAGES